MDRKLYQDRKRDKVRAERLAAGQPLEFTRRPLEGGPLEDLVGDAGLVTREG
jgi:hypothetical protein